MRFDRLPHHLTAVDASIPFGRTPITLDQYSRFIARRVADELLLSAPQLDQIAAWLRSRPVAADADAIRHPDSRRFLRQFTASAEIGHDAVDLLLRAAGIFGATITVPQEIYWYLLSFPWSHHQRGGGIASELVHHATSLSPELGRQVEDHTVTFERRETPFMLPGTPYVTVDGGLGQPVLVPEWTAQRHRSNVGRHAAFEHLTRAEPVAGPWGAPAAPHLHAPTPLDRLTAEDSAALDQLNACLFDGDTSRIDIATALAPDDRAILGGAQWVAAFWGQGAEPPSATTTPDLPPGLRAVDRFGTAQLVRSDGAGSP